jgi:hypothetical protein
MHDLNVYEDMSLKNALNEIKNLIIQKVSPTEIKQKATKLILQNKFSVSKCKNI